jgi:hypothetical protein
MTTMASEAMEERIMSDLKHKDNCQTQPGHSGGLNRAYWCSCCLNERKQITELTDKVKTLRDNSDYWEERTMLKTEELASSSVIFTAKVADYQRMLNMSGQNMSLRLMDAEAKVAELESQNTLLQDQVDDLEAENDEQGHKILALQEQIESQVEERADRAEYIRVQQVQRIQKLEAKIAKLEADFNKVSVESNAWEDSANYNYEQTSLLKKELREES